MALAIAGTAMVAMAQDTFAAEDKVTHENKDTGNGSTNKNKTRIKKSRKTKIRNKARIRNRVKQSGNTGNNKSTKNTSGGKIDTGKITADVTLNNDANKNVSDAICGDGEDTDVTVDLTNEKTGNGSTNKNKVKITDKSKCKITNKAKIKNSVRQHGNTGGNKSSKNTMAGDIVTGDVDFTVSITNNAN